MERVVIDLANSYVKQGVDTQVVVMSTGKRNSLISELDPLVKVSLLSGSLREKLTNLRNLTKDRIVHIHFGDGRIHPLIRTALLGRTVVVTYHSVYSHKRNWFINRADQFWASKASEIVAVSEAVKSFAVQDVHIPSGKVTVIRNGVEINAGQNEVKSDDAMITLISLASLYPHKNHMVLFKAMSIARKKGLRVKLIVIGDGPSMADLYQYAIQEGINENIEWYGAVWKRSIVQSLLRDSDIFVSASNFEGMPISILEGMSYGLPMILSDISSHRELADNSALYFSPTNPEEMAELLVRLTSNKILYEQLKVYSLSRVHNFHLNNCVQDYLKVYQKAAGDA
nr:glycosyltransferase family 4 protein [Paenibacillus shirakamiensis]